MAVSQLSLSSQLLNKLGDDNEDLQEKFKLAGVVFCSSSIPIIRKEEIIVEWLSKKIVEIGCQGSPLPYDTLNNCLSSSRLSNISYEFKRNVVDSLFEALTAPAMSGYNIIDESKKRTIISLLSSSYFQNMFCRDISSLSKLVKEYCKCCQRTLICSSSELKLLGQILSIFSEQCLLHEDLRYNYITEMMVPLCQVLSNITCGYEDCEKEIYIFMKQTMFRESNLTDKFIQLYRSKKDADDESFTTKLISILKKLPGSHSVAVVKVVFTMFLKAVFENNEDNDSKVFKVFTLLCSTLGIKVKGMISIDVKPKNNWSRENTFTVISSMVELIDRMKLSINCVIDSDITLQVWFTSMIIGLANINSGNMSPEFLKMMTSIVKLNPLLIESAHKPICTQIILCKKSGDGLKNEYVVFLKSLFEGSLQVSRLQKFISKFLSCMEEFLQFSDSQIPFTIDDVFPDDITETICNTVSMMPGSHVLSSTKSLYFHLHFLCTNKLDACSSNYEPDLLLSMEIVTHLLVLFLNGSKVSDVATPTMVKGKVVSIVGDIGKTLENFTENMLERNHNNRLMSCFLNLCHSIGSFTLLMWEYDRYQSRQLEPTDDVPTNLNYLHSYIDLDVWESISNRVHSCGSDSDKNKFYLLVMQKMTAVSQIEEGPNGPGALAARYLLENASSNWLWDNATELAPLLEDNELLGLLESLNQSAGLDHSRWIPFVSSDYFSRYKRLVVAASIGLLSAMSKHIHKNRKNGAVSYRVMSKVAVVPLLEHELSRLIEDNEELECDLRSFFEEMIAELETYLLEDPPPASSNEDFSIGGFIEIITKISYEECSYAMEVCMLIAVISLLCDIPNGTNNDDLLLDKLNGLLREPRMNSPTFLLNLHSGALLRFLVKRTEKYPQQQLLIQRFCNFSITSSDSNRLLVKYVKSPSVSTLWQTTAVIKSLAMRSKNGDSGGYKNKSVTKLLHAAVPLLEKEEASSDLLHDYFVCLKQVLKLNDQVMLFKLLKRLKDYLYFALTNFDKGKPLIKLCLKRLDLASELPPEFSKDLWNKVFKGLEIDDSVLFTIFCRRLSSKELKMILEDMHTMLVEGLNETSYSEENIKRCLLLWKGVIWADLWVEQKKEVTECLILFITPLLDLVSLWSSQPSSVVLPVLDFLAELGHCPALQTFGSHLLDMYLIILGSVPLEGPNTLNNLNAGLDALVALFMFRRALIIDRLPPFLHIFRLYAKSLGSISKPTLEGQSLFQTTMCANKLARGAEIMIKLKKDFVRLSPYIISDLLGIFEANSVHPDIKVHFVNTLSSFYSILDDHGLSYLVSALNPACLELHKTYYDQFTRYYKYHGKI